MYKDKDKQREANRKAQAKFKAKGITEGITSEGITASTTTSSGNTRAKSSGFGTPIGKLKPERTAQGNIRVSKPGDEDYVPQCETTRAFIEDVSKHGGEYSFKTVKGEVQDVHHTKPNHFSEVSNKVEGGP